MRGRSSAKSRRKNTAGLSIDPAPAPARLGPREKMALAIERSLISSVTELTKRWSPGHHKYLIKIPTPGKVRDFRYVYPSGAGLVRRGVKQSFFETTAGGTAQGGRLVTRTTFAHQYGGLKTGTLRLTREVTVGTSAKDRDLFYRRNLRDSMDGRLAGGQRTYARTRVHDLSRTTDASRARLVRAFRNLSPVVPKSGMGKDVRHRYGARLRGSQAGPIRKK